MELRIVLMSQEAPRGGNQAASVLHDHQATPPLVLGRQHGSLRRQETNPPGRAQASHTPQLSLAPEGRHLPSVFLQPLQLPVLLQQVLLLLLQLGCLWLQ